MQKLRDYLSARISERTTAAGLASLAVSAACLFFPEYSDIINAVAGALGIGIAVTPTGGKPK
jgi:hypothetical protein